MGKFDYLVVGSGLYGAIFAHEAKVHGKSVLVVDKRPNIAGNVYTENVEGINVHKYGAHIFHTNNKKVWNYITQFAEFNRFTNSPVANYKGELYSLPFNMYTFNKMWAVVTPEEAAAKIEEQRKEITGEPQNLEEQAISLTCCESEDEEARKFSKRTAYIETGVNLADLSVSLDGIKPVKNDKFTVFTLGRACVQKQPQLFNRIAELVPDARFVWIGNGELENELSAPNIEVTGWKPRKEALAMAKGAEAFVLCSLGEAIAMSLIENMYIKKLILVSNTMGNKSVINNGVNGYVCNKAEEYAEHIKAAMKEFPKELPERAYQDVFEIYNTHIMKKKYIKFYNNVMEGRY